MTLHLVIVTARRLEYALAGLWKKVKDYVQASIQPPQKEVIQCAAYFDGIQPENEPEGTMFIDVENGKLYEIVSETLVPRTPDPESIYVVPGTDNQVSIYVYADGSFKTTTSEQGDSSIIIRSLSELDDIVDPGLYTVQHVILLLPPVIHTLSVAKAVGTHVIDGLRIRHNLSQYLINKTGYSYRYRSTDGVWSDWVNNKYSFEGHKHTPEDITGLNERLDELEALAAAGL